MTSTRTPEVNALLARAEQAEHRAARLATLAANHHPRPSMPPAVAAVADMDDDWITACEEAMPPIAQAQVAILAVLEARAARMLASELNRSTNRSKP